MMRRVSPERITSLKQNQIFVFGSNLAGRHGAGAALQAMQFGALYGKAFGRHGQTYAIPTKNYEVTKGLDLKIIGGFIYDFINYAKENPHLDFLVTEIGCGLAGHKQEDVGPLFNSAILVNNIYLPKSFLEAISG